MFFRFTHRFVAGLFVLACGVVRAQDCTQATMPNLMLLRTDMTTDLAFLATITASNFDAQKKNAEIERGLAEHPEMFEANNPVGLNLPIAKSMLKSSDTYERFARKRGEQFRMHQFQYADADLATYFLRSLPPHQVEQAERCMKHTGFYVAIVRADRDLIELSPGWISTGAVTEHDIAKFVVTGGIAIGNIPTKLKSKDRAPWIFARNLDADFRISATIDGAPISVFIPRYIPPSQNAPPTAEPKSVAACASAAKVVQAVYRQLLSRDATAAEIAQQSPYLTSGKHNVLHLVEIILAAPEYGKKFAEGKSATVALKEMYRRILGREPDQGGLDYNAKTYNASGYQKVALAFAQGREYQQRFGDWTVPSVTPSIRYCPGK